MAGGGASAKERIFTRVAQLGDPGASEVAALAVAAHEAADDPHPQYLTQAAADALYDAAGDAAVAVAAHAAADDPHPQYLTQAEADALYATGSAGSGSFMLDDGDATGGGAFTIEDGGA